ncbi:MAG: NF038122 family metalloprotease, partial [Roseiarcus sp.]
MQINISYDQSVGSLPAGFVSGVTYAVNYLDSLFTNNVTITIAVGYGEIDGVALSAGDLGESETSNYVNESYSAVSSALLGRNAPGASTLPASSPDSGSLYMDQAEAKALGLYANDGSLDGYVGFSSSEAYSYSTTATPSASQFYFVGIVEHEITEDMGRVSLLDQQPSYYSPIDLYRYSAAGVRDLSTGGAGSTAYFSTNNGVTNLGTWNNQTSNGDLADWYPSGPAAGGNDAFNDYTSNGVIASFSPSDTTLMEALGWTTIASTSISVAATSSKALQGGSAVALLSGAPTISDSASTTLSSATIKITSGGAAVAGDQLYVNGVQTGSVGSGVTAGWSASTDTLTLTGSATLAVYDALLGAVSYKDTGIDASSGGHPLRTVNWSVTDGTNAFSATSQIAVDRAPVASNDAASDSAGSTLTTTPASGVLSNDTDLDGDSLTVTGVSDASHGNGAVGQSLAGAYGHLTIFANGAYSYAADLTTAINAVSPGNPRVDSFTYAVSDGSGGTASATLNISVYRPPVVTVSNVTTTVAHASVAASSLFAASDPDGRTIATYGFINTGGGYFVLNGVAQPSNKEIDVTAAQLSQLAYQSVAGSADTLEIRAYDGAIWSGWNSFVVTGPAVAIQTDGSTTLTESANNFYLYNGGGTGPELKYGGANVVAGGFGGWTPIGAVQTASGYQVAWKMAGANEYTVWNTDSSG